MNIPEYAAAVLRALNEAGFEAYIVGGCVRDSIMGMTPHDYDVTTSALPQETERVFAEYRVIETGIKHGTVTVLSEGKPVEITTFRIDGEYHDGRHPDGVSFTRNLRDDLSRRDFTINGMAYSHEVGLVDLFGGREDIKRGIVRCIGEPKKRFGEDALRILRALRFAAVLGFSVEENTARAAQECAELLDKVSRERIFAELKRLLCGKNAQQVLLSFPGIFARIIPQLAPLVGYEQNSRYHDSTLWEHTARAVGAAQPDEGLRLAMLLHDVAKPLCRSEDEQGESHYYCHGEKGAQLAEEILRRLKCDNATRERVVEIIRYHDMPINLSAKYLRRALQRHGYDRLCDIIRAHIADDMGKKPDCRERIPTYEAALVMLRELMEQSPCLSVRDLAVTGSDLTGIVEPSPKMGRLLSALLSEVVDGKLPNTKQALLERARQLSRE